MKKRTEGKANPERSMTVNIFSNYKISVDSKSILPIVFAIIVLAALVVSGTNSETLQSVRSLLEAWLGP